MVAVVLRRWIMHLGSCNEKSSNRANSMVYGKTSYMLPLHLIRPANAQVIPKSCLLLLHLRRQH